MSEHLYAVIMAGGVGSRLWPRSRNETPKQFLDLLGSRTLLQETVDRILPLIPLERLLVVTGADHADVVRSQIASLPQDNLILEPGPRNTAPCIGLAATVLQRRDPDALMAVFPADHSIADAEAFRQAIAAAGRLARDGYLVTLGIAPNQPHVGYGYIQRGEPLGEAGGLRAYRVQRFAEKPDPATAHTFLESGEYYWNAGILRLAGCTHPGRDQGAVAAARSRAWPGGHGMGLEPAGRSAGRGMGSRAPDLDRLWGHGKGCAGGRAARGYRLGRCRQLGCTGRAGRGRWPGERRAWPGRHLLLDSSDSYVYTSTGRLVAAVGLEGWIVVDTPDALLICPKDRAQAVREIVERLKVEGLGRYL